MIPSVVMFPSESNHQALIARYDHLADPAVVEEFLKELAFDKEDILGGCHLGFDEVNCTEVARLVFDSEYGWCFLIDLDVRINNARNSL